MDAPADGLKEQRRLRGWLVLFIAWLGIIGPIYSVCLNGFFALRWQAMNPEATSYFTSWSFWWVMVTREVARIMAAIVLVARRSADVIWFVLLILWLSGPFLVTVAWVLDGSIVMPSALVRSGAVAAAATLYLLRSSQVREVYRFKDLKPVSATEPVEQPAG